MLEHYRTLLTSLHTNIDHERWRNMPGFRAPHKPLLLVAIIDLLARGSIKTDFIQLTKELAEEFNRLWVLAMGEERMGNLALPFFHLQTDGFWKLVPVIGKDEALASVQQVSSLVELQALVQGAVLDEPLFELLGKGETREELRTVLLETYFAPDVRSQLLNIDQGVREYATPSRQFWWVNQGAPTPPSVMVVICGRPKLGKMGESMLTMPMLPN